MSRIDDDLLLQVNETVQKIHGKVCGLEVQLKELQKLPEKVDSLEHSRARVRGVLWALSCVATTATTACAWLADKLVELSK